MKLLIITQKVDINDDVLGFMHGWIAEFAKHCEKLTVICLQKGEYNLPNNVKVLSLGKEKYLREKVRLRGGAKRRKKPNLKEQIFFRIKFIFYFYRYIWQERNNYDKVFVHMNTEYVVLGGVFWRLWKKKIGLWYAHGHVPLNLKIAEKFVDVIFTSTKSGCRLQSKKIKVVGQGIPSQKSKVYKVESLKSVELDSNGGFKIITVGRISPVKDYETLINAIEILVQNNINLQVEIVGGPLTLEDEKYLEKLKKIIVEKKLDNIINFVGSVSNKNIVQYYNNADLFVNMSMTGSLDKVILEAMACGAITLSCNDASKNLLEEYNLFFKKGDYKKLAEKIKRIINLSKNKKESIQEELREIVVKNHSLKKLIKNIIRKIK